MKQEMDTIQFESRDELQELIAVLESWQAEHGSNPTAQELLQKLTLMQMMW